MARRIVAGIDAGSTAIKLTFYDGARMECWLRPAGWSPREEANALLMQAIQDWGIGLRDLQAIFGTGYGRAGLSFLTGTLTEISCHAKGAAFLWPGVHTVVDVGGQDAKAIRLGPDGKVWDFVMNDKCAAGTGRFLQVMANTLGLDLDEIACMPFSGESVCKINAMCTVFAESEVIGLLNKGVSPHAIMAGLYKSVASRIGAMASRIHPEPPVLFTGGVSHHQCVRQALAAELKLPVIVPEKAVYAGAIGAALFAWEELGKGAKAL